MNIPSSTACEHPACWICQPEAFSARYSPYAGIRVILHRHLTVINGGVSRDNHMCDCSYFGLSDQQIKDFPSTWRDRENKIFISHGNGCRCQPCVDQWLSKVFREDTTSHRRNLFGPRVVSPQKRAWDYLVEHLTPAQQYTLRRFLYIDVEAHDGTMWRLDISAHSGNAWRWNGITDYQDYVRNSDGTAIRDLNSPSGYKMYPRTGNMWLGYCIVPGAEVPRADHVLMEYLMLKTDTTLFKSIGIITSELDGWEENSYAQGHGPIIARFFLYNKWMPEDETSPELWALHPSDQAKDSQVDGTGAGGTQRDCLVS